MMSVDMRLNLHFKVLILTLIVFTEELSNKEGVQAWTYHYNTGPNQRWLEARQWCQTHFTDMVPIRSQEETEFLNNLLPFNPKYYWIGIHKVAGVWAWAESNQHVSEEDQNWATAEPDTIAGQDCVEIYIKREPDTAKWNNEKCRNKKGTVCYNVSCAQESCSSHADCVETVGNYTCKCHPGFQGPRCEEAITCSPLPNPEQGSHQCFHPYGSNRFNSSCHFHCERGFWLLGMPQLLCQANAHWDNPVPLCQVEQCPVLDFTNFTGGSMNCSHPIAPNSYNSTCDFRCDEGFELFGLNQIQCDNSGKWTASVPACTVKKCSPMSSPVMGNMTCVDAIEPFSFGSQCNFSCQEGYSLTGDNPLTCLASGQWKYSTPACTVVQCSSLTDPPHAHIQCQDPVREHSYGSKCTVQCEEGYNLIGTNVTKCSSQGTWSHALPVCQAVRCPSLTSAPHGSLFCSDPHGEFSFGSQCKTACEEGFSLNGTADTDCTSAGKWSTDIPKCRAKRCPTLTPPAHGSVVCSDLHGEFSFGSLCMLSCVEGFNLNGTNNTECTSMGTWNREIPHCLAKRCPTLRSPSHGSFACSDPHGEFSFGSRCTSACGVGFLLTGWADTECTAVGTWSTDMPHCQARQCPLLAKAPQHGRMNCNHPNAPFSYGSHCGFECNEGFWLRGTPATTCNNSGQWSQNLPTCQPVQCQAISGLPLSLSMNCSHPLGNFSFGSQCLFSCNQGFSLNGTAALLCSSSGFWNDSRPNCTGMSMESAMLLYTGAGAATAVVILILIGLVLLIMMQFRRKGNTIVSDVPVLEDRENPAFEF
ncbi:P-selectin [Parambassis ranga]|uniref:E-selectin n=1 Tax=Parambassis ranga TaxID=210632 RepID=A0A6P7I268_9TELE|nr:P-selectin [Parambassis ranga]